MLPNRNATTLLRDVGTGNNIDPEHVVFVDETWTKTNMTRTFGRSRRGTLAIEGVSFGHRELTTFVGDLRVTGFTAPLTVVGPINGRILDQFSNEECRNHFKHCVYRYD